MCVQGNIRVFCRVRPLLGDETLDNDGVIQHMNFPDLDSKVLEIEKLSNVNANEVSSSELSQLLCLRINYLI